MAQAEQCDLAIAGGGLAGGLIALALAKRQPEMRVTLVEPGPIGGNHIWSFFDSDAPPEARALLEPLIAYRWPAYDVAFPAHRRTIAEGYASIDSERLDAAVRATGTRIVPMAAVAVTPTRITLADQSHVDAAATIDARGPGDLATLDCGWQKFVGRELITAEPHGVTHPVVMDATVDQIDGYRFVYLLPFGSDRLFVEDTYYSDGPQLDVAAISARIDAYAAARGWRVTGVGRAETGVLPVVIAGDHAPYWDSTGADVAKAGGRAGLFHPTTGYSLPDAADFALTVAGLDRIDGPALAALSRAHAAGRWDARGFYRMLDIMLFRAARPEERYRIMERFYRLDAHLIARFYAARSTPYDKLRILTGRPPIPIPRALAAILRTWTT